MEVSGVVFREGAPADTVLVLQAGATHRFLVQTWRQFECQEGSLEVSVCGRQTP